MHSFQRHQDSNGWRWSAGWRTRQRTYDADGRLILGRGVWEVQRWIGTGWDADHPTFKTYGEVREYVTNWP
jgi:hypothetical protein